MSLSLKCPCGCLTRVKYIYVEITSMWHWFRNHVVFTHCMVSRLAMWQSRVSRLEILEILHRRIVSPSLKWLRGCLTRVKFIYVKSAWMWDCFRYHVVSFDCTASHLAMYQSRVFSKQVHSFVLSKMSSRLSHAWKIFLREMCVHVRLLLISCTFLLLHCLGFSSVQLCPFSFKKYIL